MTESEQTCNAVVTGGAGFIGSHLVDALIEEKPAKLIAVDNLFLGRQENLSQALMHRVQLAPQESIITDDGVWIGAAWLQVSNFSKQESIVERRGGFEVHMRVDEVLDYEN